MRGALLSSMGGSRGVVNVRSGHLGAWGQYGSQVWFISASACSVLDVQCNVYLKV